MNARTKRHIRSVWEQYLDKEEEISEFYMPGTLFVVAGDKQSKYRDATLEREELLYEFISLCSPSWKK